jgi:hypothetical protein
MEQHLLQIDLEDSIYVFPNPSSSAGSATSLGSDISTPTDLTLSPLSRSRSRHSSNNGSFSRTRSSGHVPLSIRQRGVDGDPELEIWDWNTDMDGVAVSDESSLNMEEVDDRAHRLELLTPRRVSSSSLWRARQQKLDSITSRALSISQNTHRRQRNVDSDLGPIILSHHKRMPMLSFIASVLFIDESTFSLLTHPSSEPALFTRHLDSGEYPPNEHSGAHDIVKLFAGSEERRSLREGLAVACDPEFTPLNPFAFPSLRLGGLRSLVNGVWIDSRRALREIWA